VCSVSFEVSADAYGQFMARYSEPLAVLFADLAGVRAGQRALDVGCGPGAQTAELVRRLGTSQVTAIDPSRSFVAATRERLPEVDVRLGNAERLPFDDISFDVTLAQLVVQFMTDPLAGLREMARVTRPGGVVAACVWDRTGGRSPTTLFWRAAHDLDPSVTDGTGAGPGVSEGDLPELFEQAGITNVRPGELTVRAAKPDVGDLWGSFLCGVGPQGDYVLSLDEEHRGRLRQRSQEVLAAQPAELSVTAWTVTGQV
jgi:SAM-dependent methyltransferase